MLQNHQSLNLGYDVWRLASMMINHIYSLSYLFIIINHRLLTWHDDDDSDPCGGWADVTERLKNTRSNKTQIRTFS